MRIRLILLWMISVGLTIGTSVACSAGATNSPPMAKLRKDHPRLFINKQTLPDVRARALGPENANYEKMKAWLDKSAANPPKKPDHRRLGVNNAYLLSGNAFVYLVSGDKVYRDRAVKLLEQTAEYFRKCDREERPIHWWCYSRINAIVAYDWLYNDLSAEDRKRIGKMLLDHVEAAQKRMPGKRRNVSGYKGGMYGTSTLLWYVGLATCGDCIDDKRAGRFTKTGYDQHMKMLAWRRGMAGDDGGSASASVNYAMAAYPYVEFNFFHTMESAFGADMPRQWPHVGMFVNWVMWNWIAGPEVPMEFGTGDAYHRNNHLPIHNMYDHLAQIRHFCSRSVPDGAALARWMQKQLPKDRQRYLLTGPFPWMPFVLTRNDKSPPPKPPSKLLPPARHFEHMGQIFMRSGSKPSDTYALFTAGCTSNQHKHCDENNFVIYKKGHLALDTGTRPEPGVHITHYYGRTVAHNCITIHMPGEKLPRRWGRPAPGEGNPPVPNDGGMNNQIGAKVKAFETHKQFTYIASDATPCYNKKKCRLALRQFVFVPPNHFVIFDRVTAAKPEYKKTFILHSPVEPKIEGDTFSWAYEGGRLFCRTILPGKAKITKIGGPGKQFFSDGRNWPIPLKCQKKRGIPETNPLLGQWRVEVSPMKAQKSDFFLHLIEVGDRKTLKRMCDTKYMQYGIIDYGAGVSFQSGARRIVVNFKTDDPPGGRIKIYEAGKSPSKVFESNFTNKVQKQTGLVGTAPKK